MIGFLLGHLGLISGLLAGGGGVLSMFFPKAALAIVKALGTLPKPVFIAACGLLAFLFVRAEGESRHWHKQSDRYEKLYNDEHSGRLADRKSYADAQIAAAAKNKAHVETENKLREQINEASSSSFIADRDRLRAQSRAPKGAPGAASIPSVPKAAPGTPAEVLSLPPAELLRAQELELQLNSLIDWVTQQSKVDPNTP